MYDFKEGMIVKYRNGGAAYVYTKEWLYHIGNGQRYRTTNPEKLVICDLLGSKISEDKALKFHLHWKHGKKNLGYGISEIRDLYQKWLRHSNGEKTERKTHNLVYDRPYATLDIWPDTDTRPEPKHITGPPRKETFQHIYSRQAEIYRDLTDTHADMSDVMRYEINRAQDQQRKEFLIKELKEKTMQETMNRLNGLKLGEEKLVELRQDTSMSTTVSISLASILENNEQVKKMGLGKESLLTSLTLRGENIEMVVSEGEVVREGNQALLTSINELLTRNSES